jgi:hypothetical protein
MDPRLREDDGCSDERLGEMEKKRHFSTGWKNNWGKGVGLNS